MPSRILTAHCARSGRSRPCSNVHPGPGSSAALDVAEKLNVIADITAVPYRTMYSDRPGELGLLMGKGLVDSRKTI
jgi:hypothetical protein